MVSLCVNTALALDGSGTQEDPWRIQSLEDFNDFAGNPDYWDDYTRLETDVNLAGRVYERAVIAPYLDIPFTGVFDGSNHKIYGLTITTARNYLGLLGRIDAGSEVKNLGLENVCVNGLDCLGGLCGLNHGTVTNCYVTGSVSVTGSGYLGGLCGANGHWMFGNGGTITECNTSGSVSGFDYVGGLCGENYHGTISNCYATSSVTGNVNSSYDVGGLLGSNSGNVSDCYSTGSASGLWDVGGLVGYNSGTVSNCSASGDVNGSSEAELGGLVGYNEGEISNCYSTGDVSGEEWVGGLCGWNDGSISNCYSTGSVSGYWYVGGLVGENGWEISNCYSTGSVSGYWGVGGMVGGGLGWKITNCYFYLFGGPDNHLGSPLDEVQLTDAVYFSGFDFAGNPNDGTDDAWTIVAGHCPKLSWQTDDGPAAPDYAPSTTLSGSGHPYAPFQINGSADFTEFITNNGLSCGYYILTTDIDLVGLMFNTAVIKRYFGGHFDGSNHVVRNITIDTVGAATGYLGLFSRLSGSVRNLGIENIAITGGDYSYCLGGLCGWNLDGTVSNCYATGSVTGGDYSHRLGGLCGWNSAGEITNCYSTASVLGDEDVGGLVGENGWYGTITNCYATGSVTGHRYVGGLLGYNYYGRIANCYSTGSVSGFVDVGGLVGYNWEGTISNCYSTGNVSGDRIGGLVGYNKGRGEVINSFWDIETSGQDTSDGGTGLPTHQMQMVGTFTDAGWDFVGETVIGIEDIWFIPQQDYPHLWWEGMQVPMKLTPRTLNCRSYGNWVKAHLTLPQGFTVADVDPDRPAVLHSFGFQSAPLYVFINKDKVVEIEAAFERQAVCSLAGNWPQMLTVAGFLTDGNIFLGTSTVRINHPGLNVIEELASYWLNADCVHPDFCNGIDMNRDSLVNLLDYALLMNINVEFVTDE
jgi:hypothetical protein